MPGCIIVTATDSRLFWLAKGLVLSVAEARRRHDLAMVCFDLGLTVGQRGWIEQQGVDVVPPPDLLDAAGREGFEPYMLGQLCRPFLPTILPGHDGYIWLDADVWVQAPDGIEGLLHVMRYGLLGCCPELHVAYTGSRHHAPQHIAYWRKHWEAVFGREEAERNSMIPMVNSGVVAAPAKHPVWARWEAELRLAIERPLTHLSEQLAFFRAVTGQPKIERLPAHWNWLANFARPRWHGKGNCWIEPGYPHHRLRIIHLAAARCRPAYLKHGMLFRRGDYLSPDEIPAEMVEEAVAD